jgi:mRNA interferase HicA
MSTCSTAWTARRLPTTAILPSVLIFVTKFDYDWAVKASEFRRWLKKPGCTFADESRHTRIVLGSKISRMPRHPANEIKTGTLQAILKDLGLKMRGPKWNVIWHYSNRTASQAAMW